MHRDDILGAFDLSGRVAIVTGGSRGIGRAIAEGFAAMGASVAIASRKADACEATVASIEADGGTATALPTHLGHPEQLDALVAATVERFGGVDILVNNAANALAQPIGSITEEAWDKSMSVNLKGPVFLTQAALPHLRASEHASVINIVSAGIYTAGGWMAMYLAAKSAMAMLTKSMAAELAGDGVRINALAPGTVDTDMVRNNSEEVQAMMVGAQLMPRLGTPKEMMLAALYLASDASAFTTGQVLVADGGLSGR